MKKNHIIFIVLALIAAAAIFLLVGKPMMDNRTVATPVNMKIDRPALDVAFSYPSGEAAYTLIEPPVSTEGGVGLQGAFLLMDTSEYIEYQNGNGDTPASVSVFVIELPDEEGTITGGRIARLQHWAEANAQFSSYGAIVSEPEVIELDGVKGLRYRTSGEHEQEVNLVMHRGRVYVFTSQFEKESDAMYEMYTNLMNSVLFY